MRVGVVPTRAIEILSEGQRRGRSEIWLPVTLKSDVMLRSFGGIRISLP